MTPSCLSSEQESRAFAGSLSDRAGKEAHRSGCEKYPAESNPTDLEPGSRVFQISERHIPISLALVKAVGLDVL
jgi:hypothetical protein